ncbi:hypothetical protein AGABI1DRAFT_81838, partial [Agaricus bisporus var. burnettii JB137-S8]
MRKTREIIEQLSKDIPTVKRWVESAAGAPRRFPSTEWGNIIKGHAVNLHHVLAGLHISRPVPKSSACVGGLEIDVSVQQPAKRIETGLEWQAAWAVTVDATAFVFPHRRSELLEYGSFIIQKFASKAISAHPRIIL